MDYQALWNEISTDPTSVGYAGMTDAQIADSLNAQVATGKAFVTIADLFNIILQNGKVLELKSAAKDSLHAAHAAAATAIDLRENAALLPKINWNDPLTVQMRNALQSSGIFTQTMVDAMAAKAAAEYGPSRAQQLGLSTVGDQHIVFARQLYGS